MEFWRFYSGFREGKMVHGPFSLFVCAGSTKTRTPATPGQNASRTRCLRRHFQNNACWAKPRIVFMNHNRTTAARRVAHVCIYRRFRTYSVGTYGIFFRGEHYHPLLRITNPIGVCASLHNGCLLCGRALFPKPLIEFVGAAGCAPNLYALSAVPVPE